MHTITNVSRGRHQVKTLDQGLVFMDPGDVLTATIESTYAKVMGRAMALSVEEAPEGASPGLVKADPGATAPKPAPTPTEQPENGAETAVKPADDSTDKEAWTKYATSKGIDVKKSWGVNRIKTELAQMS